MRKPGGYAEILNAIEALSKSHHEHVCFLFKYLKKNRLLTMILLVEKIMNDV